MTKWFSYAHEIMKLLKIIDIFSYISGASEYLLGQTTKLCRLRSLSAFSVFAIVRDMGQNQLCSVLWLLFRWFLHSLWQKYALKVQNNF